MQWEASEYTVQLRLITVISRLVQFPTDYSASFVELSYDALRSMTVLTPFYYVCQVMLRLSRLVMDIIIQGKKT